MKTKQTGIKFSLADLYALLGLEGSTGCFPFLYAGTYVLEGPKFFKFPKAGGGMKSVIRKYPTG